jgi:hypothetical protein
MKRANVVNEEACPAGDFIRHDHLLNGPFAPLAANRPMTPRSVYLRDQAAKCRWHANTIGDAERRQRMGTCQSRQAVAAGLPVVLTSGYGRRLRQVVNVSNLLSVSLAEAPVAPMTEGQKP